MKWMSDKAAVLSHQYSVFGIKLWRSKGRTTLEAAIEEAKQGLALRRSDMRQTPVTVVEYLKPLIHLPTTCGVAAKSTANLSR